MKNTVRVAEINDVTEQVRQFTLQPTGGDPISFSAGGHISVTMKEGITRAYSLINHETDGHYQISVQLEKESKGGSKYMHDSVAVGDELVIESSDNYFPLQNAANDKHVFVAGGIGITPFLSYLAQPSLGELNYELHFCYSNAQHAPYLAQLREKLGDRLFTYESCQDERLDVEALMTSQPASTHVYVCGPERLINAIDEHGSNALGKERIHFESFTEATSSGEAFEVELHQSGFTLQVASDQSILQAIEADGRISVDCICRNGVCGSCETDIIEGEADHRDSYFDEEEKNAQTSMLVCVSRAKSKKIILDL